MKIVRKVGEKGQILIPKIIREYTGIKPGDEIVMEVRDKKIIITAGIDPEKFVEEFCSTTKKKLTKEIDLERLLEQEVEERLVIR